MNIEVEIKVNVDNFEEIKAKYGDESQFFDLDVSPLCILYLYFHNV